VRRAAQAIGLAPALCLCALGVSGAPAAAQMPAGPASAPRARLRVAFDPDRAGARTTIELSLQVSGAGRQPPPPLRSLALRMPPGMGVATTTLGQDNCSPASLQAEGLAGCSPNSVLGFGSATAVVPVGAGKVLEHASLHPLMGPPHESSVEVLFYAQASSPVFAQLVLPAVLAEDVPPYGEQLRTSVPLVEVWPEGPDLALESFSSTIGPLGLTYERRVGSRTVRYRPRGVRIPTRCPARGYPFAAQLSFLDGRAAAASYRVPCPPHR
jgi:hypothetical protein